MRVHYNHELYEEEYPFVSCPTGSKRRTAVKPELHEEWCELKGGVRTGPYQAWRAAETDRFQRWRLVERGRLERGQRVGRWYERSEVLIDHGSAGKPVVTP